MPHGSHATQRCPQASDMQLFKGFDSQIASDGCIPLQILTLNILLLLVKRPESTRSQHSGQFWNQKNYREFAAV
jgi:hypothetical protein